MGVKLRDYATRPSAEFLVNRQEAQMISTEVNHEFSVVERLFGTSAYPRLPIGKVGRRGERHLFDRHVILIDARACRPGLLVDIRQHLADSVGKQLRPTLGARVPELRERTY